LSYGIAVLLTAVTAVTVWLLMGFVLLAVQGKAHGGFWPTALVWVLFAAWITRLTVRSWRKIRARYRRRHPKRQHVGARRDRYEWIAAGIILLIYAGVLGLLIALGVSFQLAGTLSVGLGAWLGQATRPPLAAWLRRRFAPKRSSRGLGSAAAKSARESTKDHQTGASPF
jgi:hypothetical protein